MSYEREARLIEDAYREGNITAEQYDREMKALDEERAESEGSDR